jgi:hypothetical protein
MISKKGKDAKKIFTRLVKAFKRLPPYFKPETDGNTTPKTELVFAKPSRKRSKQNPLFRKKKDLKLK